MWRKKNVTTNTQEDVELEKLVFMIKSTKSLEAIVEFPCQVSLAKFHL
jgi:hypothetical protein